jgi:hypothetical protein
LNAGESVEMSLDEIEKKYAPLWVALRVTGRDAGGQPAKGTVICQHTNRDMLSHELTHLDEKDVCIFQAMKGQRKTVVMI